MKIFGLCVAVTSADFRLRMRLCSDDATSNKIVTFGNAKTLNKDEFTIKIGAETEQKINLNLDKKSWNILEEVLPGDLAVASTIELNYDSYDILCLETLEVETLDGSHHYKIIQVSN